MDMTSLHESNYYSSDTRIRKRIRSRILSYLPLKITFVCLLLVCLASLEHHQDSNSSPLSITLVYASEVDDDGPSLSSSSSLRSGGTRHIMNKADIKIASSVIQKTKKEQKEKKEKEPLTMNQILIKAGKRGLGGGLPGAIAGVVQVLTLMWLRTVINYQCRYGASFFQAVNILNNDGGIPRFYRGLSFALVQAPLSRFVSTAANDGVEIFFASLESTKEWGPGRTTVVAGFVVGIWRMMLMPIDTCKTVLQVDSVEGFRYLMRRVKAGKIGVLYQGAIANALSAFVGHYPWFFTYNTLSKNEALKGWIPNQLLRNAGTGLVASIVSDTAVNAIRVVKTTKQSIGSKHNASYAETIRMILAADGWKGLFGRGLRTRIFANALQSMIFTVIWRGLADFVQRSKEVDDDQHAESDLAQEQ